MSAFEPQPATERVDVPEFLVVLRGYDRRQVDVWAKELIGQIDQERRRADDAEKGLYRAQVEAKTQAPPSFSQLGAHAAKVLEEAGTQAENMLADAADRARETIEAAEGEAGEIVKASEGRAAEIEQAAQSGLEEAKAEATRVEVEANEAAEQTRAQADFDAKTILEEARDATDLIWQEAQRERKEIESETNRLQVLRQESLENLGRVYGHLESILQEVRHGISGIAAEEEFYRGQAEAQAQVAAERGAVEPVAGEEAPAPEEQAGTEAAGQDAGDETVTMERAPAEGETAQQPAKTAKSTT